MGLENIKRKSVMAFDKTVRSRLTYAGVAAVLALAVVGVQAKMLAEIDERYVRVEHFNIDVEREKERDHITSKLIDEWFKVAIQNRESLRVIETDVKYLR